MQHLLKTYLLQLLCATQIVAKTPAVLLLAGEAALLC
jgi:hypothetical protein